MRQIPRLTSCIPLKVHVDKIFGRQDILHFSSEVSKDYKYVKSPKSGQGLGLGFGSVSLRMNQFIVHVSIFPQLTQQRLALRSW